MKKIYLIIAMFIFGCLPDKPTEKPFPESGFNYRVFNIEGCEYIQRGAGTSLAITHKGNCSNPVHCYNNKNITTDIDKPD